MKREEAVAIYKEIMNIVERMGSNAFNLKLSKIDDPSSGGYQICIAMVSDTEIRPQIAKIATKHNLVVKEEKGEVIIFKTKA